MLYKKTEKFLFFSLVFLFIFGASLFVLNSKKASATTWDPSNPDNTHNLSGFAWADTIGWISFNSANCDSDDNGLTDKGNYANCQMLVPGGDPVNPTWGVTIDRTTKEMTGYAWSSNVGWICFGTSCTGPAVTASGNDTADAYFYPNYIDGYAQVVSLGDDGWISLDGATYGVTWNPTNLELEGYAWNGNDTAGVGIGWISFNANNCDTDDNGFIDVGCGGDNATDVVTDYYVIANLNLPPTYIDAGLYEPVPSDVELDPTVTYFAEGDNVSFRAEWSEINLTDHVIAYFCKHDDDIDNSSGTYDTWRCNDRDGNGNLNEDHWCASAPVQYNGTDFPLAECSKTLSSADIGSFGAKNIFVTLCDEWGECVGPYQIDDLNTNDAPDIDGFSGVNADGDEWATAPYLDDGVDDEIIHFSVDWTDTLNNGFMNLRICKSNNFTESTMTCDDDSWCELDGSSTGGANSGTLGCEYTALESDAGDNDYYVYVCDDYGTCTSDPGDDSNKGSFLVNLRPEVTVMSAPNFGPDAACKNDVDDKDLQVGLYWTVSDGDSGSEIKKVSVYVDRVSDTYQIELDDDELTNDCATNPSNNNCESVISSALYPNIGWGESYTWQVRVNDGYAWSDWRNFDHSAGDTLTNDSGANADSVNGDNTTFTTYAHNFPVPIPDGTSVGFQPDPPSAGEETKLTPPSVYYEANKFGSDTTDCSGICSYNWSVTDGSFVDSSETEEIPRMIFNNDGDTEGYGFTVTDPDGYTCSTGDLDADVNKDLPSWTETY